MTDPSRAATVLTTLKRMPEVSEAVLRSEVKRTYDKLIQQNLRVSTITITLFAAILAFGVVYNSGRIALSERARDLMSLRVLGFTKGEVLSLLLGQQFIITMLSLPVGLFIGYRLCLLVPGMMDTELYRMPVIFTVKTLAFSMLVVLVSSILSSLLVARRVSALSIVDVLKTRE
jgi:putative ABC transport system permease protein